MSVGLIMALAPFFADGLGGLVPLLVIVFVAVNVIRAVLQAKRAREEHQAGADETESEKRAREIRERLRRVMAERRGEPVPSAEPPPAAASMPRPRHDGVPPLEPFGGSLRRILEELAPPVQRPRAEPPVVMERRQVEPEVRPTVQPSREGEEGPAAPARIHVRVKSAPEESSRRVQARQRLLGDLRDTESLRRAFVLREVLGPPVSLRGVRGGSIDTK